MWRLEVDLPEVQVAGVLYESSRPSLPLAKRVKRFLQLVPDRSFRAYVMDKLWRRLAGNVYKIFHELLRWIHAGPKNSNGADVTLDEIIGLWKPKGTYFHITNDVHNEESLSFVRSHQPDLGVIFGTRILKPQLFTIPRRGSINIHKHKVPDYRGGGNPGIWELQDGREEAAVTVHRVVETVDAGGVLGEAAFPIDHWDNLESVGLKADLLSIDLLIQVIRAESRGAATATPQPSGGKLYKGYKPHQIFEIEKRIRETRPVYKPARGWHAIKLLIRSLFFPVLFVRNRWRRMNHRFPVIILFHHLVTDKKAMLGMPTSQFARQIRFLKKHYHIASLPQAIEMLDRNDVSKPIVVLTFDDGYAENFLCLRAVAEAEQVPVTLFVCTQIVAGQESFSHDVDRGEVGLRALSWDEVRYFDRHGAVIGSHTRTHFDCGSTDAHGLNLEISGAKEDLRRELSHDIIFFSFPKGHPKNMSTPARQLALELYPYVFSAYGGGNYAPMSPPCIYRRFGQPDSLWELELQLQEILGFHYP